MAKRSQRMTEGRERIEPSCMWGLFSILQSCHGFNTPKLISNGRDINRNLIDNNSRKLDQVTSFDGECRRIQMPQKGVDVAKDDLSDDKDKTEGVIARGRLYSAVDAKPVDGLTRTQKKARRNSQQAYRASSSRLDDAASAGTSLNKLTLAALLDAVAAQNCLEEGLPCECFQRSIGNHSKVDHIRFKQAQISAKVFVDRMFIDREIAWKQGTNSQSKCFSNSLAALNSNKAMSPQPKSPPSRGIKNLQPSLAEIDVKFSENKRRDTRISGILGSSASLAAQDGKMSKHMLRKIDNGHRCSYSPKTSSVARPFGEQELLKTDHKQSKCSEQVSCHCSPSQSPIRLSGRVVDANPTTSLSFREMKKKLKHAFGGTSSKSSLQVGDDCMHFGSDAKSSFDSSTRADANGKKPECKSHRDSDISHLTDTVRKKLDFSGVGFSNKLEFDVILEAKRHLSERLKNLSNLETSKSEKSSRTLRGVLDSPEHDFWSLSPKWGSEHVCGSPEMRFSPYNSPLRVDDRVCLSPLRPKTRVSPRDDHDSKRTQIPITNAKSQETDISAPKSASSNGDSRIAELAGKIGPESHTTEVSSEIYATDVTITMQTLDITELHKYEDSAVHSLSDSLSENGAFASMADDFQSTPSSAYTTDSTKYQEEYQSPVSVLEPLFTEDANSPQTGKLDITNLKPRRLKFEDLSFESIPHDPPMSATSCIVKRDPLSEYIYMVMQASCLDWDRLSKNMSLHEELLDASLFDEIEFVPAPCYFETKLLFDHINEVLLEIHQSHFCSCPWLASLKPKTMSVPLVEHVLAKITAEADFYLLPLTEKRTLDQLVSKDVACCRSWLDVRLDNEEIVIDISEDILEDCTLDIVIESLV